MCNKDFRTTRLSVIHISSPSCGGPFLVTDTARDSLLCGIFLGKGLRVLEKMAHVYKYTWRVVVLSSKWGLVWGWVEC